MNSHTTWVIVTGTNSFDGKPIADFTDPETAQAAYDAIAAYLTATTGIDDSQIEDDGRQWMHSGDQWIELVPA